MSEAKVIVDRIPRHFSKGSHDLGCFREISHTINTGDEKPIKQAMQRTPLGFEKEEEENLKLMLHIGVIT